MGRLFKDSKLYAISEGDEPSEYIQEGLLFELDCTKAKANGIWKASVGNAKFTVNQYTTTIGREVSFNGKDGVVFTPYLGNVAFFDYEGTFELDENKDYYIEVCCKYDDVRELADNNDNLLCMSFGGLKVNLQTTLDSKYGLVQTNSFADKKTSRLNWVDAQVPTMYGEVITLSSSVDGMNLNATPIISSIGSYGDAGPIVGIFGKVTLYSVRVYDKSLIDVPSVMRFNYSIDQKRFVAPPVSENALVDVDDNYILDAEGNYIIDNN